MQKRYHALENAFLAATLAGAVAWWWRRRPFRVAVEGESMEPTLRVGDFLVAVRPGPIRRGAIVVLEHPERPGYEMVKRLGGVPGDAIGGVTLDPHQFWVVGDDLAASTDSRAFGPVSRSEIVGVVRLRYWPPSRLAAFR